METKDVAEGLEEMRKAGGCLWNFDKCLLAFPVCEAGSGMGENARTVRMSGRRIWQHCILKNLRGNYIMVGRQFLYFQ